jgi:hypothetical protein
VATRSLTPDEERELARLAARVRRARAAADRAYEEQVTEWIRLRRDGVPRAALARAAGLANEMSIKFAIARRKGKTAS